MSTENNIEIHKINNPIKLNTKRSRKCKDCSIVLNPGDIVYEYTRIKINSKLKPRQLASKYSCDSCNTKIQKEELQLTIDEINTRNKKLPEDVLTPEQINEIKSTVDEILNTPISQPQPKKSIIEKVINWFKQLL